ncbi:ribonuclease H [Trifolium pratense]|uniref:Ribonuclease H n=1 Tax=Trifolium pratense TaxID=57577 RepID=A0A2K3L0L0_TRIPR|nr:ribonuclease H [Trifolium pratense]
MLPAPLGPGPFINLDCDGAMKNDIAGCGGVLRDQAGTWIMGFAKHVGNATAYIAELWGVYEGLKLARRRGFERVELRIDSMVVVRSIQGQKVNHVYREADKVADALATMGCSLKETRVLEEPSFDLEQLCLADVLGVSTPHVISM